MTTTIVALNSGYWDAGYWAVLGRGAGAIVLYAVVGLVLMLVGFYAIDLTTGKLVRWGDVDGPEIAIWTLYPSRRLLSARVSAFLDFLKQAFPSGTPDELAGFID